MTATAPPTTKTRQTATTDGGAADRTGALRDSTILGSAIRRVRWVPSSLRTRILAWFIGVLALATIASVVVTYQVLLLRLDKEIDAELTQEAMELTNLASGNDPDTGRPFGTDVRRIFEVYLRENVPSPNEAHITFVGGEPFLRSAQVVPYRLDDDAELVARWSAVKQPDRGSVDTPAGRVEYLALPLRAGGEALSSPPPSTRCSTGWSTRSVRSAASSTTPATSSRRR